MENETGRLSEQEITNVIEAALAEFGKSDRYLKRIVRAAELIKQGKRADQQV